MSLALSGHTHTTLDYGASEPAAIPTPTIAQEAESLAAVGHSVQQIAIALGMPTAQVDSTLNIHSAETVATTLSIHV
jgi:hypothetical protein